MPLFDLDFLDSIKKAGAVRTLESLARIELGAQGGALLEPLPVIVGSMVHILGNRHPLVVIHLDAKRPRESVERTAPYAGSRNDRTILEARL